jgi:hypothetical protein
VKPAKKAIIDLLKKSKFNQEGEDWLYELDNMDKHEFTDKLNEIENKIDKLR